MAAEPDRQVARLEVDDIEALARRVAELLAWSTPTCVYLDTAGVARMLGASEDWVRAHAAELGAIRLGDGCRGALRFDAARVGRALDRRRLGRPAAKRARPRPGRRTAGVTLLPLPTGLEASR
jgi:hypothetical protein